MVDKLKNILATVESDKGKVALFAIARMDEFTDRWTVILSAEWVRGQEKEVFSYLVSLLVERILPEIPTIARVGVYTPEEHLIEDLLKFKKGSHITETTQANGNVVHEAYILESRSSVATDSR